jgi:NAD-dependent deacetylase
MSTLLEDAAELLRKARHGVVFTGAGMSVESGVPSFRGPDGLWTRYDPKCLEIAYFRRNPKDAWGHIKEIFFDSMGKALPNAGHRAVAELEAMGLVKAVVTQNIDTLHQAAGSRNVYEFHGTIAAMRCTRCGARVASKAVRLDVLPPWCGTCNGVLKPDFVFFGEPIPEEVGLAAFAEGERADVMLVVGTTGEVTPACNIPYIAKAAGAAIIEVNLLPSSFTDRVTDIFLHGGAATVLPALLDAVKARQAAQRNVSLSRP